MPSGAFASAEMDRRSELCAASEVAASSCST
eukprot:CAMPEP_0177420100 /NCGR_PEP_ID=MMETSP0368-20130122/70076_1 /TAXON_ID=447022 ORGANISM="Scrippsiella hangoei-like, Strain SHHI-4" /NCGR_SAMPLE_ID=MMETSP0368 /ASSEMBLY_ACC=CAM_ASM_000363 /LENGTH=30 /DNA_ID= /DNA_START= /DNA_END= /DNA_ORIENTATION=